MQEGTKDRETLGPTALYHTQAWLLQLLQFCTLDIFIIDN